MSKAFSGYCCWDNGRVGQVINKEALSVDEADFLATHVPVRGITWEKAPGKYPDTDTEAALLEELNRADRQNEHTFAVIKGVPGTGKSHLIRWLGESYKMSHPKDKVLLVERTNTSLRGTIRQLINSKVFDDTESARQLQRLERAADILSEGTLAERLLNSLQEATHAIDWADAQKRLGQLNRRVTPRKIECLFLDVNVREALKQKTGPIQRITRFLTEGDKNNVGLNTAPGFEATDFDFGADLLYKVRGGAYPEAVAFCADLKDRIDIRDSLVKFLNYALSCYAIGSATQLTTGHLREMFGELRTRLRTQGKNLALFIEDITSFTGLDEGLIEALITQHLGEGNKEFCRLISVVGATDGYYDHLQTNIQARVSHLVTLNGGPGDKQSKMLLDPEVRVEFGARYLNALRVPESKWKSWLAAGASPAATPNACTACHHRKECHAAFGCIKFGDGDSQPIGLYPFNHRALVTMYDSLRGDIARTPRAFLTGILAYVLTVHGPAIQKGDFPPGINELANDVLPPAFNPIGHKGLVTEQGKKDAMRLETLFLFWGDRNVFRTGSGQALKIGGLSAQVFQAFGLEPIPGRDIGNMPPPSPRRDPDGSPGKTPQSVEPVVENPYAIGIDNWINGQRLYEYNHLADLTANFIKSQIDWQPEGISWSQVDSYISGGHLMFEGQSGKSVRPLQIQFERSPETGMMLRALSDLNDRTMTLTTQHYGDYLTSLSLWISKRKPKIITFVRDPDRNKAGRNDLLRVLVYDCVLLACLSGTLTGDAMQGELQLYSALVASCVRSREIAELKKEEQWKSTVERINPIYPKEWLTLAKAVNEDGAVRVCRDELLQFLNCTPSSRAAGWFLDAAPVIEILRDWISHEWALKRPPAHRDTTDRIWDTALRVYETLASGWESAWRSAQGKLEQDRKSLAAYLGTQSPADIFDSVHRVLDLLGEARECPRELYEPFNTEGAPNRPSPVRLATLLGEIDSHFKLKGWQAKASLAAHYSEWVDETKRYLEYFEHLQQTLEAENTWVSKQIAELRKKSDGQKLIIQVEERYDALIKTLVPFADGEDV